MDILAEIAQHIVREQELIIGPLAREEANQVDDIVVRDNGTVLMLGDRKIAINQLVARYERLFGRASVQVCRDAAAPLLPSLKFEEIPDSLR